MWRASNSAASSSTGIPGQFWTTRCTRCTYWFILVHCAEGQNCSLLSDGPQHSSTIGFTATFPEQIGFYFQAYLWLVFRPGVVRQVGTRHFGEVLSFVNHSASGFSTIDTLMRTFMPTARQRIGTLSDAISDVTPNKR